jgi:hypothetical protein
MFVVIRPRVTLPKFQNEFLLNFTFGMYQFKPLRPDRSGAHPACYLMGTERGKARLGRDADHSPPSSAEVKYE